MVRLRVAGKGFNNLDKALKVDTIRSLNLAGICSMVVSLGFG